GDRHRVDGELQSNAAIDFLAEVLVAKGFAGLVVDDAEAAAVAVDAIDLAVDAKRNVRGSDDERIGMIDVNTALDVLRAERVFEVARHESGRENVGEIARNEIAEDAFRGAALDRANVAIERRCFRFETIEFGVDRCIET